MEPLADAIDWKDDGLALRVWIELYRLRSPGQYIKNEAYYFKIGVAFTTIGADFSARAHRFPSICDVMGASVFADDVPRALCSMNRRLSRMVLESLNPSVHFQVGDVNRLPIFQVPEAAPIASTVEAAFAEHERGREGSVEFIRPGSSSWTYTQAWAQQAVDHTEGAESPPYEPAYDAPSPETFVSFAVGIALGRFGATGEGILDQAPASALPNGLLFLSTERADSLDHPACAPLHTAWREHGAVVGEGDDLRTYLRKSFFDYHKKLYENRPIYFPLSSAKKSFVAFASIHRWADDTLNVLLADHLIPVRRRLEGEVEDLRVARVSGTNKAKAEKRFTDVQKLLEELNDFIAKVTEVAEKGPPPPDDKTPKRDADARYVMDLDDGVMVNSAALWPLLEPQWKDPKKWWKELATASGKKDYDWSHLAARYFPARVRKKCHDDPSLAVAHKCFWALHPAKAYARELRLQDEIRPDFTIDEPGSHQARTAFLADRAPEAAEIRAKELKRREKKNAKVEGDGGAGPLFDEASEEPEASDE
jgi:hypothetical protein